MSYFTVVVVWVFLVGVGTCFAGNRRIGTASVASCSVGNSCRTFGFASTWIFRTFLGILFCFIAIVKVIIITTVKTFAKIAINWGFIIVVVVIVVKRGKASGGP